MAGVMSYDDLPPTVQAKLDSLYQACDFKIEIKGGEGAPAVED